MAGRFWNGLRLGRLIDMARLRKTDRLSWKDFELSSDPWDPGWYPFSGEYQGLFVDRTPKEIDDIRLFQGFCREFGVKPQLKFMSEKKHWFTNLGLWIQNMTCQMYANLRLFDKIEGQTAGPIYWHPTGGSSMKYSWTSALKPGYLAHTCCSKVKDPWAAVAGCFLRDIFLKNFFWRWMKEKEGEGRYFETVKNAGYAYRTIVVPFPYMTREELQLALEIKGRLAVPKDRPKEPENPKDDDRSIF